MPKEYPGKIWFIEYSCFFNGSLRIENSYFYYFKPYVFYKKETTGRKKSLMKWICINVFCIIIFERQLKYYKLSAFFRKLNCE